MASGEVTPAVAALFETLLSMLQMLVLLLLEKKTKKTSQTSDLPSSLTPFDKTAASRKGSKRKGPKPERGQYEKVRREVQRQTRPFVNAAAVAKTSPKWTAKIASGGCWSILNS